jgi:hypothetical protein
MKKLFFVILLSVLTLQAQSALIACGDHPLEKNEPEVVWTELTKIHVDSRLEDVFAVICIAKKGGSHVAEKLTYRDADDYGFQKKTVDEFLSFQPLITDKNLPPVYRNLTRKGVIITLQIGAPQISTEREITTYPLQLRFHRYLTPNSRKDIREISIQATLSHATGETRLKHKEADIYALRLFVPILNPRFESVSYLDEKETVMERFFVSSLSQVGDLF